MRTHQHSAHNVTSALGIYFSLMKFSFFLYFQRECLLYVHELKWNICTVSCIICIDGFISIAHLWSCNTLTPLNINILTTYQTNKSVIKTKRCKMKFSCCCLTLFFSSLFTMIKWFIHHPSNFVVFTWWVNVFAIIQNKCWICRFPLCILLLYLPIYSNWFAFKMLLNTIFKLLQIHR